ncbi:nuclease-related domain-containing protein [Mycolicibacterium sp. F2034L]|uniref:nuclease-related domain-containing protein n=1 Tax=Mycolicibacterium sp. F2034L TaxID=2926422 RepID=UPI001FF45EFE|nr:nuclease-related domain-containing protein [Mycolicibacterium sp. F2034L]MCK0177106.1 NERD domain-containing protein [Mycolicibacterium sp. F2034L]
MSNTTTQQVHIDVFYGDRPAHESERRAISAIRTELQRRGVSAVLLVNFFVLRGARQLDLVIIAATRCIVVELKALDPTLPLIATANGPWQQCLPNGTRRPIGHRNFFHQAKEQTLGLSDEMSKLAKARRVPAPLKKDFYRQIDTVVAIAPRVPEGSQLQDFDYVEALGLDGLVDYLTGPGRGLTHWAPADWDELIRELGLYPEADDGDEVRRLRADRAAIEDYQRRFREAWSGRLHPLISASGLLDEQAITVDADRLKSALNEPVSRVLLVGASGDGKTHAAQHAALRLTQQGRLVVWVSADDYTKNDFGVLIKRAMSPYSTEPAWALLRKADDSGVGVTVVIDALQASAHRHDLLIQLNALLLRIPATVLVTTSSDHDIAELFAPTTRIQLASPQGEERTQLADAYGTAAGVAEFAEYRTRYDISVAAQVIGELPVGASRAEVLDAYISRLTPSEAVRAGLRCVATAMDAKVTTVLPVTEVIAMLRRCPPLINIPTAVDEVLDSRLISVHQGRLRFGHERQGRFLAAEQLVVSSQDGGALGQALAQPTHEDLRQYALHMERDPARRYDAIRELADHQLLGAAARGAFGADTAAAALAEMTELLVTARMTTPEAVFEGPTDGGFWAAGWHSPRPWSPTEQALLRAIGLGVLDGLLLDEVGELLDVTDKVLRPAMIALREQGHRTSISTVFASVYAVQYPRETDALAAAYICGAIDTGRIWGDRPDSESGFATRMWRANPSLGRLHVAALLSRPLRHQEDAANVLDLIRIGWQAGGYHLRLEVLEAARFAHHVLTPEDREAIADVLDTFDANHNIALSSLLVEVLGRYGRIEPVTTADGIEAEINGIIADPDDPERQRMAVSIVSRQYEDELVFGPYGEVVYGLPDDQRLTLYAMSVLAPGDFDGFGYPEAVKGLAEGVTCTDDLTGRAVAEAARRMRLNTFNRQDCVAGHLHGLRGWAKISDRLPEAPPAEEDESVALLFVGVWRLVDELLFPLLREDQLPTALAQFIWERLQMTCPGPATAVLSDMRFALVPGYNSDTEFAPHDLLLAAYPEEIRIVMQWALTHRDELKEWPDPHIERYVVNTLGRVGIAATAEMLRHYVDHPDLGQPAIAAIKSIESRYHVDP